MSAIVREKIKALERKKAQLRRREAQLINDRRHLLLRNALLSGWCEALSLLQIAAFSEEDSSSVDGDAATEQFQLLLKEEIGLLQELTVNEKLSSCSIDDAAQLLPEPDCISPGDPMAFFRNLVAKGPAPEATYLSTLEVATMLREAVLTTSLYLNVQEAQPAVQGRLMARTAEIWDRYTHVLASLIMVGREDVSEGVSCFNLDTLEARPEYAVASEQRTALLPSQLNFTDNQKDVISAAVVTSQGLIDMIHKQREEVLDKLGAAAAAADAASNNSPQPSACNGVSLSAQVSWTPAEAGDACQGLASSSRGSSSSSNALSSLSALNERQQHLEMQQQLAARLKLLMAKEYTLIMALCGLLMGCMTYKQATLASVLAWPYTVRMPYLARDVHAMRQEELAEQQRCGLGPAQ